MAKQQLQNRAKLKQQQQNVNVSPEQADASVENKLDLYEKQSDDLEPDDNPGDYGKKRKINFEKFFNPSEIKLTQGDD